MASLPTPNREEARRYGKKWFEPQSKVVLAPPPVVEKDDYQPWDCPASINVTLINAQTTETRYVKGHPFSFSETNETRKDFYLDPMDDNYPMATSNDISKQIIPEFTIGTIPAIGGDYNILLQNLSEKYKNLGYFKIKEPFLRNNSTYNPVFLDLTKEINTLKVLQSVEKADSDIVRVTIIEPILPSIREEIFYKLGFLTQIEILSMNQVGLDHLPDAKMPKLRIAEFCANNINDGEEILGWIKNHRSLAIADFRQNRGAKQDNITNEIIAQCPWLKTYNLQIISVLDRVRAMKESNVKFEEEDIDIYQFFHQVKLVPEIAILEDWAPNRICHLSLPNCGLNTVRLHDFDRLISLNLSGNNISQLLDTGICNLKYLLSLDLSDNSISDIKEFKVLPLLKSLIHLWLSGNKITKYREDIINLCAYGRGTAAMNGLKTLDDVPVSINEYMSATWDKNCKIEDFNKQTSNMNTDRIFGMNSDKDPAYYENAKCLQMVNRGLTKVFLEKFIYLTHLNLRGNKFSSIQGLDKLKNLQYLDLSDNTNLKFRKLVDQLKNCVSLRYLMLAPDCWRNDPSKFESAKRFMKSSGPEFYMRTQKSRQLVLDKLLPSLNYLIFFNRIKISIEERLEVYKKKMTHDALEIYKIRLAIIESNFDHPNQNLSPEKVAPGIGYDTSDITSLTKLDNYNLKNHPALDFSLFPNLVELNLSHNEITSLTDLKLEKCKKLRRVDLSFNNINERLADIANIIDSIPSLEMISLHDNPFYTKAGRRKITPEKARQYLIESLGRLKTDPKSTDEANDPFRVLDYEITPEEIILANPKFRDKSTRKRNKISFYQSLKTRAPSGIDYNDITEINLNECGLKYVDFSECPNLVKLYLANNKLDDNYDQNGYKCFKCMEIMKKLEILDLRNNRITEPDLPAYLIRCLESLKNLGILGNPVSKSKNYRRYILQKLGSKLTKSDYHFGYIDDIPILPSEIAIYKNKKLPGEFPCELAMNRNKVVVALVQNFIFVEPILMMLDLSHTELCNLTPLAGIKRVHFLNLSHNNLNMNSIEVLSKFGKLRTLNISNNNIGPASTDGYIKFARVLDPMKGLVHLQFQKNPICPKKTEYKTALIKYNSIIELECQLQTINKQEVTIEDRLSIIAQNKVSQTEIAGFRTLYILNDLHSQWYNCVQVRLQDLNLEVITPLSHATTLQVLDISHNKIKTLAGQGLENLPNLKSIDIRDNLIKDIDATRNVFSRCPRLQIIYMQNSTENKRITSDPKKYLTSMTTILRGVQEIDHYPNTNILSIKELNALKDIEQMANWNNPNHLHEIDLTNKDIGEEYLPTLINALKDLNAKKVDLRGNPCREIPNYRFMMIYIVTSLTELDGDQISGDEKLNAYNKVKDQNRAIDAGVAIGFGADIGMKALSMANEEGLTKISDTIHTGFEYAAKFGSALMKWEIFITFQQLLAQIVNYIDRIKWPKIFMDFVWFVAAWTIDLSFFEYLLEIRLPIYVSYIKFFAYILLPPLFFILYHHEMNEQYWRNLFVKNSKHTLCMSFVALLMAIVCGAGIALLFDFNYFWATKKISNNSWAWFTVFSVVFVLIVIVFWIIMCHFKRKHDDPVFWMETIKFKQRFSLFFLTILYYPICKNFVEVFQCQDGHSLAIEEVGCFNGFDDLQVIHITSFVFGIIYIIAIPVFFVVLINDGVRKIDIHYRINEKYDELYKLQKDFKEVKTEFNDKEQEEIKELIRLRKEEIDKEYSEATNEYANAASYLYSQYTRKNRFQKVISMIERLAMLLFTAFLPTKFMKALMSSVTIGLMTILQLVLHPLAAFNENVMEGCGKVFNCASLAIGEGYNYDVFQKYSWAEYVAPFFLIGFIVVLLLIFIFLLCKVHAKCCRKKIDFEALDAAFEADMEGVSVYPQPKYHVDGEPTIFKSVGGTISLDSENRRKRSQERREIGNAGEEEEDDPELMFIIQFVLPT